MKRGAIFKTVPHNKLKKSGFPLDYTNTFTTEMGRLTPIMCQEVLPGDTMKCNDVFMTRFMPMLSPVMGRIDCTVRYFFVPNRLLWNNWQDFITGGSDGTLEPAKPYFDFQELSVEGYNSNKSLLDYLGFGLSSSMPSTFDVDAMPILAYHLIYQEYYRDQNIGEDLQPMIDYLKSKEGYLAPDEEYESGKSIDSNGLFWETRDKCWQKDYFTSALPWAQRGPAVTIPIGNSADVNIPIQPAFLSGSTTLNDLPLIANFASSFDSEDDTPGVFANVPANASFGSLFGSGQNESDLTSLVGILGRYNTGQTPVLSGLKGTADLSNVTGITINDLRLLARTQRWLEMNAVGGGRYVEQTLAHWDEIIPDYTIQRPQYLGGATFPVQISEVLQTALASTGGTTSATAQGVGQMYGHGVGVSGKPGFKKHHFTEHGWIIGLCSFMPHVSYFQGVPRKFTRFDKFDYAWNELAHLGEQEVLNKEIYVDAAQPNGLFGYQSRYAEYKYNPDEIHGDFRGSLFYWTLGRKFNSLPKLNGNFMIANPLNHIFAVQSGTADHILCMCYHNLRSSRKLPKYGQPGIHII